MSEQTPETPVPDAPEAPQEPEPTTPEPETPTADDSPEETEPSGWDPERAKAKIRKINSENKALRERTASAEEKAAKLPDLETQTQTLGSENLRLKVGYELGLPLPLAMRLQGSTREEMLSDAEALVELISPAKAAPATGRPVERLKPGATPSDIDPTPQDAYPADFLPRRMRDRLADHPST